MHHKQTDLTPKKSRRSLGALAGLFLALAGLGGSSGAPAVTAAVAPNLQPTARQKTVARNVANLLEENHFARLAIDDRLSGQVYTRFLDALDGQRQYFVAEDIRQFTKLKLRFDDMIKSGDVEPAYTIIARFQQRSRERLSYAVQVLSKEPNFALDEYFEFEREKAPWPANTAELNELWRKRVKNDALSLLLAGKTWPEAADVLKKRYERALKRIDQVSSEDAFENLMNAYARSFDPHSSFFSPRNSEEYKIQMSLNYEGIGASLNLVDDIVQVINVIEGGPAAVDGTLKPNDRITAVGQGKDGALTDVVGWRVDDVVQLIRGKGGSVVRLQLLPAGAAPGSPEKTLALTRGKVSLEAQAAKKEVRTIRRGERDFKIGIINVPGFYTDVDAQRNGASDFRSTTRDVARLLAELRAEKIDGLVMDLRGNGGGYLPEAQSLTGLFINRGPVVQLKYSTGDTEVLTDPDSGTTAYDGPLAVLVDRFSASASEIFAGAVQDYKRGVVLGQRTFGKGTVQNLFSLDRWSSRNVNGQITVTIGKFYRVTGESTQHRGVEPDVPLASPIDIEEIGESALEAALPWDRIAGVPYRGEVRGSLGLARLASDENLRAQRDPDYRWLLADIAAREELRRQTKVTLNLEARRAERARIDQERLARENARRESLKMPVLKSVDEIKDADEPDAVLEQSAWVMSDLVMGGNAPASLVASELPAATKP
jgi:carboxyl-terminal processing protease